MTIGAFIGAFVMGMIAGGGLILIIHLRFGTPPDAEKIYDRIAREYTIAEQVADWHEKLRDSRN